MGSLIIKAAKHESVLINFEERYWAYFLPAAFPARAEREVQTVFWTNLTTHIAPVMPSYRLQLDTFGIDPTLHPVPGWDWSWKYYKTNTFSFIEQ